MYNVCALSCISCMLKFVYVLMGHMAYCMNKLLITCLYNFDPLKPHFYVVKLGLGVYIIFLISAQKHRLWGTR